MPLTDDPVTLEGGCNCRAIRYRINVPSKADRPLYLAGGGDVTPKVYVPMVATDHCNDCRSATGSMLNHWLITPLAMVSISVVRKDASVPADLRLATDVPRGPWKPAHEVFMAPGPTPDNYISHFKSSNGRRRYFCSRCGTMIAYNVYPTPEKWPGVELLDIILGTVDRENLEGDDLTPQKQMWWDCGISWVQKQSTQGIQVPKHPRAWVTESVRE